MGCDVTPDNAAERILLSFTVTVILWHMTHNIMRRLLTRRQESQLLGARTHRVKLHSY